MDKLAVAHSIIEEEPNAQLEILQMVSKWDI
jgi:hypothetical protein